jgi:hypothetical protein
VSTEGRTTTQQGIIWGMSQSCELTLDKDLSRYIWEREEQNDMLNLFCQEKKNMHAVGTFTMQITKSIIVLCLDLSWKTPP